LKGCCCRALWRVERASILQRPAALPLDTFRRYCLGCELCKERCGAKATGKVLATYFWDVAERFGRSQHVIATCEVCGLLMRPQQSFSVAHLNGLDKTGGDLKRDRALPRLGLLAPSAAWLSDTAAGHPRLSRVRRP